MEDENDPRTESIIKSVLVLILIADVVLSLTDIWQVPDNAMIILVLIRLAVLYMIIRDGSILKSKVYSTFLSLSALLLLVGAVFKIMHWTLANPLLLAGCVIAGSFYTVRFALKPQKQVFDVIKWIWVLSYCILSPLIIFHYLRQDLRLLPDVFILLLLLGYLKELIEKRRLK